MSFVESSDGITSRRQRAISITLGREEEEFRIRWQASGTVDMKKDF